MAPSKPKLWIHGFSGRMGQQLAAQAAVTPFNDITDVGVTLPMTSRIVTESFQNLLGFIIGVYNLTL